MFPVADQRPRVEFEKAAGGHQRFEKTLGPCNQLHQMGDGKPQWHSAALLQEAGERLSKQMSDCFFSNHYSTFKTTAGARSNPETL